MHQHMRTYIRQYVMKNFVGKLCSAIVLGLFVAGAFLLPQWFSKPVEKSQTAIIHSVPVSTTIPVSKVVPVSTVKLSVGDARSSSCSGSDRTYLVVGGDTLSDIGARYGIDPSTVASHNHIANPDLIFVGQTICIPLKETVIRQVAPQPPIGSSSIVLLINQMFGPYGSAAVAVARCESSLNPNAYNPSGAAGLFQIMPATWAGTSEAGQSRFNASANIAGAHEIFVRDGYSWREWVCQP